MRRTEFSRFAWGLLIYTLAVIVWGAYVRASFSGDGCGQHWPTCGGQIIPTGGEAKKYVEFAHRMMSVGMVIPIVILIVWAYSIFPKGHQARLGATLAGCFTISEALLGALLVLYKLVAHNQSNYRVVAETVHLLNTFVLLGVIALAAWWGSGGHRVRLGGQSGVLAPLLVGLAWALLLSISGHMSALGDMFYPGKSLMEGLRQDFDPAASLLLRLRPLHPFLGISLGVYMVWLARRMRQLRPGYAVSRAARIVNMLFHTQLIVGLFNFFLRAPVPLQVVHLFLADLVWVALLLLSAAALTDEASVPAPERSSLEVSAV